MFPFCLRIYKNVWKYSSTVILGLFIRCFHFHEETMNPSLKTSSRLGLCNILLYTIAQHYAPVFLEADEAASIITKYKREYYRFLARAALRFRGRAFWRFHRVSLTALSEREPLDWPYLTMMMGLELLWLALNPGMTTLQAFRSLKRKKKSERAPRHRFACGQFGVSGIGPQLALERQLPSSRMVSSSGAPTVASAGASAGRRSCSQTFSRSAIARPMAEDAALPAISGRQALSGVVLVP